MADKAKLIEDEQKIKTIEENLFNELKAEYQRGLGIHGYFLSLHDGWGAFHEESDELWDEIKMKRIDLDAVITEALHASATSFKIAVHAVRMKAAKS